MPTFSRHIERLVDSQPGFIASTNAASHLLETTKYLKDRLAPIPIEKPLTSTPKEACLVLRKVAEKSYDAFVGYYLRFTDGIECVKRLLNSKFIVDVVVSTDNEEVEGVAKYYGASIPLMIPANLSGDSAPEWNIGQHALSWLSDQGIDIEAIVVSLPNALLRSLEDVNGAIEMFVQDKCDGVVCGTDAHRNPFFNMVTIDDKQRCTLAMSGEARFTLRQDAPIFYDLTKVCYVISPDFTKHQQQFFDGDIPMLYVPEERSVETDMFFDFGLAELIHENKVHDVHE